MNFKTLYESFQDGIHAKGIGYTEIYKNPTKSELKEIAKDSMWDKPEKYFRIALDKDFNLYTWKVEVLHDEVEEKTKIEFLAKLTLRDKGAFYSETRPSKEHQEWRIKNRNKIEQTIQKYFPNVTLD